MANKTNKFKVIKKAYLVAIKERSKALVRALKDRDELEKYDSFVKKEEAARRAYYEAATALHESLRK
jgi:hypothetical protein